MIKTTLLSLAVVVATLGFGACNTPTRASTDHPPVEPYSSRDTTGTSGTSSSTYGTQNNGSSTYNNGTGANGASSSQYSNGNTGNGAYDSRSGTGSSSSFNNDAAAANGEKDSLRARRDAIIDELYGEYGGSETAKELKTGGSKTGAGTSSETGEEAHLHREQRDQTAKGTGEAVGDDVKQLGKDVKSGVSGAVSDADRSVFAMRCEAVGKGETPIYAGDEKAKDFFARADVKQKCADVARISQQMHDENKALSK